MLLCPIGEYVRVCACVRAWLVRKITTEILKKKSFPEISFCNNLSYSIMYFCMYFFSTVRPSLLLEKCKTFVSAILVRACSCQHTAKVHVWWQTAGCTEQEVVKEEVWPAVVFFFIIFHKPLWLCLSRQMLPQRSSGQVPQQSLTSHFQAYSCFIQTNWTCARIQLTLNVTQGSVTNWSILDVCVFLFSDLWCWQIRMGTDASRLPLLTGEVTDGGGSTAAVIKYHI